MTLGTWSFLGFIFLDYFVFRARLTYFCIYSRRTYLQVAAAAVNVTLIRSRRKILEIIRKDELLLLEGGIVESLLKVTLVKVRRLNGPVAIVCKACLFITEMSKI